MTSYLKYFKILFLSFTIVTLNSCSDDDDNATQNLNIVQTLSADSNYSSLVAAVSAAGLAETLSTGEFTVFAPDNDAFQVLLDSNNAWNQLSDIPTATLTQVLLNHVIAGRAFSTTISTGYVNTRATYGGTQDEFLSMYLNASNGVVINGGASNGGASVTRADITASNGVIHQVDAVISLPTVVTFAAADANFSTLVTALTSETPNTDFVSILNGSGPYTVFAPTNTAFQALLDSNTNWNSLSDIGESTLTNVLLYHVANGNVRAGDLTNGLTVETLNTSSTFSIVIPGTNNAVAAIDDAMSDNNINIVVTDVQASNGVIHVPGSVLIPDLD